MSRAVVFLADGFEECEGLIVVDLLRRAGVEVTTASIMGRKEVTSSHKITVLADCLAEEVDLKEQDAAILPGGLAGTDHLAASPLVADACRYMAENKLLAAICAAPSVFAKLGLLENKPATCHPCKEQEMGNAVLTREPVTQAGNILTGRGLGAGFPFALRLVELLAGEEAADKIAAAICLPR